GHVFYPFLHLLDGSASYITTDVRFSTQLFTEIHKLMGAKMVILDDTAPMGIDHPGPLFPGAYSIFPVIFISKTTSWPSQDRYFNISQSLNYIISDTPGIGN